MPFYGMTLYKNVLSVLGCADRCRLSLFDIRIKLYLVDFVIAFLWQF